MNTHRFDREDFEGIVMGIISEVHPKMFKSGILLFLVIFLFLSPAPIGAIGNSPLDIGRPITYVPENQKNPIDFTPFVLRGRPNYPNVSWIIGVRSGERIGYAPWDTYNKRWNLISMYSQYRGFIQATLGERAPHEHYRQYLWYDRNNQYKGVYIATLGGRPKTPDLPFGELGGQLTNYDIGNIPLGPMSMTVSINYGKPPAGMDISITPRLR